MNESKPYINIPGFGRITLPKATMTTCKSCGAPDGQRVFRHEDGKTWTQSWDLVCEDADYSPRATQIYLDRDSLCNKCKEGVHK